MVFASLYAGTVMVTLGKVVSFFLDGRYLFLMSCKNRKIAKYKEIAYEAQRSTLMKAFIHDEG